MKNYKTPILIIILASYLMIVLDISIVITALPKIKKSLHFSDTDLTWVHNAYTLFFGGLLLLGARAGDILGRRRMYIIGLVIFTAASVVIGLSQSLEVLLISRAIQGIGAAVLAPSTLALLSTNFLEGPERTRAVSYYGATAGIAGSVGLVLGGVLADLLSWRVGFFINLPIGIALMIAAYKYVEETERRSGHFDVAGALSSTLGMGALIFGIVRSAKFGWADSLTQTSMGVGVLLLVFLIFNEWRAKQPIMPLRLFMHRERAGAYSARVLFLGAMMSFWFFMTQFMQNVLEFTPLQAGISFLPATITNFAVAMSVPKLTRRFGNARVLAFGFVLSLVGMLWLSHISAHVSYLTGVALPMILIGAGQGTILGPLTASGITGVRVEDAGAASGIVNVAHQLGSSLGLSILTVVFAAAKPSTLEIHEAFAHQVSSVIVGGSVMLALALLIVLTCILPRNYPKIA